MRFAHQQVVLHRYQVTHALGAGSMGEVYLARQIALGREVALKVLPHRSSEEHRKRFELEAHIMASLRHPNIVHILDYGFLEDETPCIVMEYVPGLPLGEFLSRCGALPWHQAIDIITQAANGLRAIHEQGFVHRDLKPDNILLTSGESPQVKLVDFGVAKSLEPTAVGQTQQGSIVGTPAYMSPEQLCGDLLSERSDLYSLGIILYELISGDLPDRPRQMKDLQRRLTHPIPPPHAPSPQPQPPARLTQLILEDLLPVDPSRRLPSAEQLIKKLDALASQQALGLESSTQVWEEREELLEQTTVDEMESLDPKAFVTHHTPGKTLLDTSSRSRPLTDRLRPPDALEPKDRNGEDEGSLEAETTHPEHDLS